MGVIDGAPYYSRYKTDHRAKGYTAILAKPGLAEQASEFNEIQEMQRDYLERLGNSIFTNGSVISGCTLNVSGNTATIEAGSIFLEGLVREVPKKQVTITGIGTERIVASVTTNTITATEDPTLRDPAQGAENFGLEGADREQQLVVYSVLNDSSTAPGAVIFTLENGEEVKVTSDLDTTQVVTNDVLAERTYDENGSYKVNGLLLKEPAIMERDKIRVNISEGKAYVRGYAVSCETMTSVLLDQSTSTRNVSSESHYYNSSYNRYELSNGPVASVSNVTGLVSVIEERKFRGSTRGGYDALNHTPVDKITSIYEKDTNGNITVTYVQGRDYKLYNDQIDWSLTGDTAIEPTPGTTYYVNYVYNKTMVPGEDYSIENNGSSSYLVLLDGGDRPDDNSRMYISYSYTLARRDLILLKPSGEIEVLKGQADRMESLITPYNGSKENLELGYVDIYPTDALSGSVDNDRIAIITNYNSIRFSQEDLYTMLQRIETIEDDLAVLDMERDIEEGEEVDSLNGYFTDSFRNINKSDLAYTAEVAGDTISYTACIDYDTEELTTAANIQSADLSINSASDDYAIYGTVISAPYVEELVIKQSYATGTMLVNPYASYGPLCKIILDPSDDNWVDTNTIQVKNTISNTTYSYDTRTYSHGYWSRSATSNLRGYMGSTTSTTTTYTGTTTTNSSASSVAKTLYEYMRIKDVNVEGIAFLDNMTNIYCKFNGTPVDIIATNDTVQGANVSINGKSVKTVNPNSNGHFTGKITVPAYTPCGTVNVTFTGTNSLGETYSGTGVYSASGTLLTTTITNTTVITQHYNVLTEIDNLYSSDPLAQSFILDQVNDRVLIKIGLYFATKSTTRPAILQVRNMVNGYPGETVYAEVTIKPEDVNLPTNVNTPVVTNVVLNQPVYCEKGKYYCFVVLSDSNAYSMYYAEMGKDILGTTQQLVVNPYGVGVLFSSSNASTWTAHQSADLKFELYRSRYTGSGEIIFDEASISDVTGVFLDAAYQDNNNVGLNWFYSYQLGTGYSEWYPVDTLTFRDLKSTTNKIRLKAVISTDFSTSPYIDTKRVSLRAFIDQKTATYISTHITAEDFEEPYQALKISYQAAMPQGADHVIYYMDKYSGSWVEVATGEYVTLETKKVDEEFTQFTWNISKVNRMVEDPTDAGADFFKLRIDLTTNLAYNRPRIRKLSAIFKYN